jgi:hypothetical protein
MSNHIKEWGARILSKLKPEDEPKDLKTIEEDVMMKDISHVVINKLEKQKEEGQDLSFNESIDYMVDFSSDDFITKNIRVRPMSRFT